MPTHLRALAVLLVLGAAGFALARWTLCRTDEDRAAVDRRRNAWFGATLALFVAHDIWLFFGLAGLVVVAAMRRERNPIALYVVVLVAAPLFGQSLPGMGVLQQLFEVNHARVLALLLLLPAALGLRRDPEAAKLGSTLTDRFLLAYLLLQAVLLFGLTSATNALRVGALYALTDVLLPYYVASRLVGDRRRMLDLVRMFATLGIVLSLIAVFESGKHWLLYSGLEDVLRVNWPFGNYLGRGAFLRAQATSGQPLALGFVLVVCLACLMILEGEDPRRARGGARIAQAVVLLGLIASWSKGPWLGAMAVLLAHIALSSGRTSEATRRYTMLALIVVFVLSTPVGEAVIQYLPFVGSVDTENETYRAQLFEAGLALVAMSPLTGAADYLFQLEHLRQGEGIIDIVNSYLGVALHSGLLGLGLFSGAMLWGGVRLFRARLIDSRDVHLRAGLLAANAGAVLMLAVASMITVIPAVLWILVGMTAGAIRLCAETEGATSVAGRRPITSEGSS